MGPLQALLIARWSPKLGTFSNYQTVSEGEFCELRFDGVLRSSLDMRLDSESGIMLVVEKDDPSS
jgi:hypothetical protein